MRTFEIGLNGVFHYDMVISHGDQSVNSGCFSKNIPYKLIIMNAYFPGSGTT